MPPEKDKDRERDAKQRRKPGRVPTSCAECRRLKLRCDKNVPCAKCVSRGCGAICPDGSLTAGKGNRLILANTQQLHERIEHLCSRIRELEAALQSIQARVSTEPHPLLRTDLLQLKSPQNVLPSQATSSSQGANGESGQADDEHFIDAFGTLTLGPEGQSTFLGKTARSEYLVRALAKPTSRRPETTRLSKRILGSNCGDEHDRPPDIDVDGIGAEVFSLLPPLSEAIRLCEVYLEHGTALYVALPRGELFDGILGVVYRCDSFGSITCHQTLALLFAVFALGALLDPNKPPYSVEAQEYYYLARAAMGLSSFSESNTMKSVQTMVHIAQYKELSDWEGAAGAGGYAGVLVSMACKQAYALGLHLDSSRWKLPEDLSQQRSRLFWQLFAFDTHMSFSFGRPPSIVAEYVDCRLPGDPEERVNAEGHKEYSFHTWTWHFTRLLHAIMPTILTCKRPPYASIIELDKRIRDFPVPVNLQFVCGVGPWRPLPPEEVGRALQKWLVLSSKESTLMNLHRAYFTQALHELPNDLTSHRYLPSVMATYRSAWRIIEGVQRVWENLPSVLERYGAMWGVVLGAGIVMCILVTRSPASKMTDSCVQQLDAATRLLEDAAPRCKSANNLVEFMQKLRQKAHDAVENLTPASLSTSASRQQQAQDVRQGLQGGREQWPLSPAELDRVGGGTHLISQLDSPLGTPPEPPAEPGASSRGGGGGVFGLSAGAVQNMDLDLDFAHPHGATADGDGDVTMHPTVAEDVRGLYGAGAMGYNMFDFPPPQGRAPLPGMGPPPPAPQSRAMDTVASTPSSGHGHSPGGLPGSLGTPSSSTSSPGIAGAGLAGLSNIPSAGRERAHELLPELDFYAQHGIPGEGVSPGGTFAVPTIPIQTTGYSIFNPPPIVLDATWQSFVEQLGF